MVNDLGSFFSIFRYLFGFFPPALSILFSASIAAVFLFTLIRIMRKE